MKIALVLYDSLEKRSGGFEYDRHLVHHLVHRGHELAVFTQPWKRPWVRQFYLPENVHLEQLLKEFNPDIILQDELNHPSLLQLNRQIKRRQNPPPFITIVHHLRSSETRSAWSNRLYAMVESQYLKSIDGIIANSHSSAQAALHLAGRDLPVHISAPGRSDKERTADQKVPESSRRKTVRLLTIAQWIPRKGLHDLVEAVGALPAGRWTLTLVGDQSVNPSYTRRLKKQIRELRLHGRIICTDFLSGQQLRKVCETSDLYCQPSYWEGYGIAMQQALGYGLPVLAGNRGGPREFIRHGENGVLLPPGRPAVWTESLARLIRDPDELWRMSRAAKRSWEQMKTWQQTFEGIEGFLHELIARNRDHSIRI